MVQRALVEVLSAIYETDFLRFSYGFGPGPTPHQALDALTVGILRKKVNWVFDADIRGFFDAIDHGWLVRFIEHRITAWGDGIVATCEHLLALRPRLMGQQWRKRHADGDVIVVRYADDFIVGFEHQHEAERFMAELRERLAKFRLELHPEKTRLFAFGRFAHRRRQMRRQSGAPETFDFLAYTYICSVTREGNYALIRHTMRDRLAGKLRAAGAELLRRRHEPIPAQGR